MGFPRWLQENPLLKNRTHIRTARPLAFLLLVAIVAALASLSFYPDSATYAQTETSETLEIPALTATSTGTNTVELSWTAVTGAVRYELWTWQDSVTGWQRLDDGSLTSISYTHGGLAADTTYWYAVRAVDAGGATSAWSEYASATVSDTQMPALTVTPTPTSTSTLMPTPTPTASTQIALTLTPTPDSTTFAHAKPVLSAVAAAGAVELSWTAVTGAVRYELLAWQDSVTGWQRLDDGSLTSTSYTHGGLTADMIYWYVVRAVNASGATSAWSEYANATVSATQSQSPTPTPTASTQIAATLTPTSTPDSTTFAHAKPVLSAVAAAGAVELSWTAVTGAVRYELLAWQDSVTGWQRLDDGSLTSIAYTHGGLTAGTTYWYAVRAVDAGGATSAWSEYANATVSETQMPALTVTPTPTSTSTLMPAPTPATTDRGALIALYEATDGDNWTHNDNWLTDKPLSTWYGVTTDRRSGRVNTLSLGYNNLTGPLPDLSALSNLTYLSLSHNNNLIGPLPDLSALINLTSLYLRGTQLTGQISDLSLPATVQTLFLDRNRLTGPIPDLSALSNLTDLNLRDNQLTGTIPTTLGNHPYLGELNLRNNQLTGKIPATLGNLLYLDSLYLSGNTFSGCIPAELRIVRNSDLERLGLPYCAPAPTATPTPGATPTPATSERAALIALYQATDGANWKRNNNWLTDKPIDLWYGVTADSSGRVTALNLWQNQLSGQIPDLSALSNLTNLDLGQNELTGPIPDLDALSNLTELDFRHNQLSGQIPDLDALSNLDHLDLGFNRLSGSIPELGALTSLTYLHLRANRLSGQIPDLSALSNLRTLYLSHNRLSGQIPDLSALINLTEMDLGGNELSGSIPDLGALSNLANLILPQNNLTGPIPDLSTLTRLNQLGLGGNRLTGPIPDLSTLTKLSTLNFSGNQLDGPIPDLSALSNLVKLALNDNRLTGPILNVNALTNLRGLHLRNNRLTGPIPDLSALSNLGYLDLSGNQLCLPAGYELSGSSAVVTEHLNRLNLPTCTDTDLAAAPAVPQNLTATVGDGQVTLSWDAVADAAGYDLWVWDSIDRQFGPIGGALTGRSYTHTVLTDGRNYYYQVRARNANGVRGGWSHRVQAIVVPQQFLPPPQSLGLETLYQKYMEVGGLHVVAPSEVSDTKMVQTREIITGMLSARSDLLQAMADNGTLIAIRPGIRGFAGKSSSPTGFTLDSHVPAVDENCNTFIHEFAHLIHFVLEELPGADEFNLRLEATYQAALTAGLWDEEYASTNTSEYWAETVTFWFQESVRSSSAANSRELDDYDPEAAKLIEETLGDATVPSYCKP